MKEILLDRKRLREIADKSTRVVGWYAHPYEGQVRGPFGRWFECSGGSNGMDQTVCPTPVSDIADDVNFASAAMNNLVPLLDELDALEAKYNELRNDFILLGDSRE